MSNSLYEKLTRLQTAATSAKSKNKKYCIYNFTYYTLVYIWTDNDILYILKDSKRYEYFIFNYKNNLM